MEGNEIRNDQVPAEPNDARQYSSALLEYIRLNMLFEKVPSDKGWEVFFQQAKVLLRQINALQISTDESTKIAILYISEKGWDFEDVSRQLRQFGGELTNEKVHEWVASQRMETDKPNKAGMFSKSPICVNLC